MGEWKGVPFKQLPDLDKAARKARKLQAYGLEEADEKKSRNGSLATYAGLLAPDMLLTEQHMRRKDSGGDVNPLVEKVPGSLGRAAYFAAAAYGLSKLHDKLEDKNPKLGKLMQAIVGGIQGQAIGDNIRLQRIGGR